jgi:hypothetical protein
LLFASYTFSLFLVVIYTQASVRQKAEGLRSGAVWQETRARKGPNNDVWPFLFNGFLCMDVAGWL